MEIMKCGSELITTSLSLAITHPLTDWLTRTQSILEHVLELHVVKTHCSFQGTSEETFSIIGRKTFIKLTITMLQDIRLQTLITRTALRFPFPVSSHSFMPAASLGFWRGSATDSSESRPLVAQELGTPARDHRCSRPGVWEQRTNTCDINRGGWRPTKIFFATKIERKDGGTWSHLHWDSSKMTFTAFKALGRWRNNAK